MDLDSERQSSKRENSPFPSRLSQIALNLSYQIQVEYFPFLRSNHRGTEFAEKE